MDQTPGDKDAVKPAVGAGGDAPAAEDRALAACAEARRLEAAGDFEGAARALAEFWPGLGSRPDVAALPMMPGGELLLRAGALTGAIGSARQVAGSQGAAKNLLTECFEIFEAAGDRGKAGEALVELGWCYWREAAHDEARIIFRDARGRLADADADLLGTAILRGGINELTASRFADSHKLLLEAAPLVEASGNHTLKGNFHNTFGNLLENLGNIDPALLEYAAASYHFERAGHTRNWAAVENNLGYLFFKVRKHGEAHEHFDRARGLFSRLRDAVRGAQVDEARARAFLAEGRLKEAKAAVRLAIAVLECGDEQGLLAEALATEGVILAKLGQAEEAQAVLERSLAVADLAGDPEAAGRVSLTILEELWERLCDRQRRELYAQADGFLAGTQQAETTARLRLAARRLIGAGSAARAAESHVAVRNIYRPGESRWFAYLEASSVYDRAGFLVALLEEDGRTLRDARSREVLGRERGGAFYADSGEVWGTLRTPLTLVGPAN